MIAIKSNTLIKDSRNQDFPNITFFQYHTKGAKKVKKGIIGARFNYKKNEAEIGWSLCSSLDKFDRSRGLDIVNKRLDNNQHCTIHRNTEGLVVKIPIKIPHSMDESLKAVLNRCEKIARTANKPKINKVKTKVVAKKKLSRV